MRVLKALGAAAVATGLVFAGAAVPASAAGGCPSGGGAAWSLVPVAGFVIPDIDNGNFADQNGDGLVCFRVAKGNFEKDAGFVFKDNSNPA